MTQELEIQNEIQRGLSWARELAIRSADERAAAVEAVRAIRRRAEQWLQAVEETVKTAHAAWKAAVAHRDSILVPLKELEAKVKEAIIRFDREQEELRKKEEEKIRAQIEKEKQELQARLESAKKAETKAAIELRLNALRGAEVSLPSAQNKTEGEYTAEVWKWEVENPDLVPRSYLTIDEKKINQVVRIMKGQTNIPGIKVWKETQLRIKT